MTALELIADLRARGVVLTANGDRLSYDAPAGALPPGTLATLKANKAAILQALAPKPRGCAWREDERGQLIFSDGSIYSLTDSGGWILTQHRGKRMIRPGMLEVNR